MTDALTSIGAVLAGLAGCGWIINAVWRFFFGGEERRANAAAALTGAAKVMVDELQEEVHAARNEARKARAETEDLRRSIAQERQLSEEKIARLEAENYELRQKNGQLRTQLGLQP